MAKCGLLLDCPFFNGTEPGLPSVSEALKRKYCLRDDSKCAANAALKGIKGVRVSADRIASEAKTANIIQKLT